MTGTFWNKRYAEEGLAYGDAPNEFLRRELDQFDPGSLLLPAEGEGRNAVWAAVNGWKVYAYDTSTVGRDKALGMARRRGVEIEYELRSVIDDADDLDEHTVELHEGRYHSGAACVIRLIAVA